MGVTTGVGNGVEVAVGGNQTIVGVGLVKRAGVTVGVARTEGAAGVNVHALTPKMSKQTRNFFNIQITKLFFK